MRTNTHSKKSYESPTLWCSQLRIDGIICGSVSDPNANSESLNNLGEIDQDLWNY